MSKNSRRRSKSRAHVSTVVLFVVVATLTLILGVLLMYFAMTGKLSGMLQGKDIGLQKPAATETLPEEETPTEPPRIWNLVTVGTGTSANVNCNATYTTSPELASADAQRVVATAGKSKLTNAQLQIYYRAAIDAYKESGSEEMPDFTGPLDCQLCPLGNGTLSWQQYFLQQAVARWHREEVLLLQAQEPQPITEEAFQPNVYMDLHTPNITDDLPVNDFLYADQDCYKPNEMHQAYLDSLERIIYTQAIDLGYEDTVDYAAKVFGSGVSADDVLEAAKRLNTSYMYFTERSFYVEVTDEEIEAYIASHKSELPDSDEKTANVRHILLIPEGAKVAANGKVTATDEQWKACREKAEQLIQSWQNDYPTNMNANGKDYNFSRWAFRESEDPGSKINGGLYSNIRRGQLIKELDDWCFDSKRERLDYQIVRTDVGIHIVFLSSYETVAEATAREALTKEKELKEWESYQKKSSVKVDYSAASLWTDTTAEAISMDGILYPDVAHERYPKAMVYLQQDYATTSYGSSTVGRGGCGVTTMAMLATYMLDDQITPAMLAKEYAYYHDANGTMAEMFRYVPAELGFQLERQVFDTEQVNEALESGRRVVSLQHGGHFTSAGHYLLLQEYYPENDTYQVRDSNIANYGKLSGHKVDYFTKDNLLSGGANFFIFQPKVTRIPACTRCGGTFADKQPELLLTEDYLCVRCREALSRRNTFLSVMEG